MKRQIKFRAYHKVTKNYFEITHIEQNSETHSHISILEQFTGLKDKNGTEIYEGDWIRSAPGYCSYVEFKDGAFMSIYKHPEDGEELLLSELGHDIEVIGNINN